MNTSRKRKRNNKKVENKVVKSREETRKTLHCPWITPQYEKVTKEVRDIILSRIQCEIVTLLENHKQLRSYIIRGVNQVTKAITTNKVHIVIFAINPETQIFAHIPILCRLFNVPICILHLSSKEFGKIFKLKSLSVFCVRDPIEKATKYNEKQHHVSTSEEVQSEKRLVQENDTKEYEEIIDRKDNNCVKQYLDDDILRKLQSITMFLASHASKKL